MLYDNIPQILADVIIVQGDTYEQNVYIDGVAPTSINGVFFSCKKLELSKQLTYVDDIKGYVLLLSSQETKDLKPITTDYDITIKLIDDSIKTGLYRGKLIVLEKTNTVEMV